MAGHPVAEALRQARAALDAVLVRDASGRVAGWASLADASPDELREMVRAVAELEGQVAGLRLHTVAAAELSDARSETGAADTAAWAAGAAGGNRDRRWGSLWLAQKVDERYHHVRAALAEGRLSHEHAMVIVRAAERAPAGVDRAELARCEEVLVAKAERMSPRNLRRAARRLLEPISKRMADEHEGVLLDEEERAAELFADIWVELTGDGRCKGGFEIPELHGQILLNALDKLSGPRRYHRTPDGATVEEPTVGVRTARGMRGQAFLELLEHLPEAGHTRSGVTLVVHVDEDQLRTGVGAATLETGGRVSIGQVRRLACEAGILPLVLGGSSVPLDLGMSRRLFTKAQAVALSAIHDSCAAEGCERPFAWCELHHRQPWGHGGPTDIANAAPLCGWHHRRVHDPKYQHQWLEDGTVRFRHRWRSRWKGGRDPWQLVA
jgi:hypothetical protein